MEKKVLFLEKIWPIGSYPDHPTNSYANTCVRNAWMSQRRCEGLDTFVVIALASGGAKFVTFRFRLCEASLSDHCSLILENTKSITVVPEAPSFKKSSAHLQTHPKSNQVSNLSIREFRNREQYHQAHQFHFLEA
jgi:hypothetical protein